MKAQHFILSTFVLAMAGFYACKGEHTEEEGEDTDTLCTDTVNTDTLTEFEECVDDLHFPEGRDETFSDFLFTFINSRKFQAQRVKYPLPVVEADGSEHTFTRGEQIRRDFHWPDAEVYTLLLTDANQMEQYLNEPERSEAEAQIIDLHKGMITGFQFNRSDGRWMLTKRTKYEPSEHLASFLKFYNRFSTDSLFQQESLMPSIRFVTPDPDDELNSIEGTLEPSQWPMFRPELPHGMITNVNFGQNLTTGNTIVLIQCGASSGMMDIYTFRLEGENWKLASYEN